MDVPAIRAELERKISGEVRFDRISRALYSTDASVYQIQPIGVVIPRTRQDLVETVKICHRFRCPLTMRGGGTSQAGQAVGEGIQVDTSKYYNRILETNFEEAPDRAWVRVEPGIVLDELNAQLASRGFRFAPDISTASRATIGGMMANNSCGARSVLYGKTIDHVLEQVVALSDGSVIHLRDIHRDAIPAGNLLEEQCYRTVLGLAQEHAAEIDRRFPHLLRRVCGYNLDEFTDPAKPVNLAKLLVGSEGTLGVVLEAKLRLVPLPKAKAVMVIGFHDLLESLAAAPVILEHKPSAIEVMDKSILDNTRENIALAAIHRKIIQGDPAATLCVEFYADRKEDLPDRLRALEQDLRARMIGDYYHSETDPAEQSRIWSLREAALGLSMAMKGDAKSISFVEDTAVAPAKLSEYIGRFLAIVAEHGTTAGVYAHASVGCLHVRPVINLKTEEGIAKFTTIAAQVADLVLEFGGAISGEHGDGMVRSPFLQKAFGATLYDAFRQIKRTFDPLGILNPGKIVDSPPLQANLRFGASYRAANRETWFDFSEYSGVAGAIEMCSGVGQCRKTLSGNMCPSYMATCDEADTTRGRANALRLAISGQLEESGLGDQGVRQVLDLCLECRACKAECPVNVDVARLKSEFLADFGERHGFSYASRALGHVSVLAEWGSRFAPVSNWLAGNSLARRFNERFLGIDRRRTLPVWQRDTFESRVLRRSSQALREENGQGRAVTLFNDTFTNHYEPKIGQAALEILEHGGYRTQVVRPGCCGRPLISQGLLREAREGATKLVNGLIATAERGEKILFCEPSCLSAVKEDIPSLLRGEEQRKALVVAQSCVLFDEFASQLDLRLNAGPGRILFHGHCHQKSMGLLQPSLTLLARIPGATVVDLDAGCCGMAGSFGYTKSHYDVSKKIAERRLIPAARGMEPGDVLVATGTSCRHQTADLAGISAIHPAILVRNLLVH